MVLLLSLGFEKDVIGETTMDYAAKSGSPEAFNYCCKLFKNEVFIKNKTKAVFSNSLKTIDEALNSNSSLCNLEFEELDPVRKADEPFLLSIKSKIKRNQIKPIMPIVITLLQGSRQEKNVLSPLPAPVLKLIIKHLLSEMVVTEKIINRLASNSLFFFKDLNSSKKNSIPNEPKLLEKK